MSVCAVMSSDVHACDICSVTSVCVMREAWFNTWCMRV